MTDEIVLKWDVLHNNNTHAVAINSLKVMPGINLKLCFYFEPLNTSPALWPLSDLYALSYIISCKTSKRLKFSAASHAKAFVCLDRGREASSRSYAN